MSSEEIFELIVKYVREVVPELENHAFEPSDSMKELGANSIDRAEIIMMTLESLSLNIPLVELAGLRNLGELASAIHGKANQ